VLPSLAEEDEPLPLLQAARNREKLAKNQSEATGRLKRLDASDLMGCDSFVGR